MKTWTVQTYFKKSVEEIEYWSKDDMEILHRVGWRTGSWSVTTSDDQPPQFEFDYVPGGNGAKDSINMNDCCYNNIEEVELLENWDGCWEDYEWDDKIDDDERERLEQKIEEEGIFSLEEEDWMLNEVDSWIWGAIEIIDAETGETVRIITADENGNVVDYQE